MSFIYLCIKMTAASKRQWLLPTCAGNSFVAPPPGAYCPLNWSRDTSLTDFQKILICDAATDYGKGYTGMRRITTDRIYDGAPIIL